MFDTLLVPLDGSASSEEILLLTSPFIEHRPSARMLLLRVLEDQDGEEVAERDARIAEAQSYLDGVERRLRPTRHEVEARVQTGDPASRIVDMARRLPVGLVAMAARGAGGPGAWLRGSVAERLLHACPVPLYLARARAIEQTDTVSRILVPLDGSPRANLVLPLVEDLARGFRARIHLLHVAPHSADGNPGDDAYLVHSAQDRLRDAGFEVDSVVRHGSPADEILEEANSAPGVLLVMASHGRRGLERRELGSVAEEVLRACVCAVFVLRIAGRPPTDRTRDARQTPSR